MLSFWFYNKALLQEAVSPPPILFFLAPALALDSGLLVWTHSTCFITFLMKTDSFLFTEARMLLPTLLHAHVIGQVWWVPLNSG